MRRRGAACACWAPPRLSGMRASPILNLRRRPAPSYLYRGASVTIVIGLTGGIASGKSVVSEMLAAARRVVIDADKVGHEAYAPGSDCYRDGRRGLRPDIVGADGEIDRKALGGKVFGDAGSAQAARRHRLAMDAAHTMDGALADHPREGHARSSCSKRRCSSKRTGCRLPTRCGS